MDYFVNCCEDFGNNILGNVWSIEELCGLLSESASATKRIDKGLILKALGEKASENPGE